MTIVERFQQAGVTLYLDNGELRYKARRGALTPELAAEVPTQG